MMQQHLSAATAAIQSPSLGSKNRSPMKLLLGFPQHTLPMSDSSCTEHSAIIAPFCVSHVSLYVEDARNGRPLSGALFS